MDKLITLISNIESEVGVPKELPTDWKERFENFIQELNSAAYESDDVNPHLSAYFTMTALAFQDLVGAIGNKDQAAIDSSVAAINEFVQFIRSSLNKNQI